MKLAVENFRDSIAIAIASLLPLLCSFFVDLNQSLRSQLVGLGTEIVFQVSDHLDEFFYTNDIAGNSNLLELLTIFL